MKKLIEYLSVLKGYKLYLAILLVFVVYMSFFDPNSLLSHHQLNKELSKLEKQKQFLTKEIEKDKKELQALYTDEGKEKLGREVYYLKHDDEEVFIIEYDTIN
nr:septum formation initiator family protein [uncultured Capnocytophaga sp.]